MRLFIELQNLFSLSTLLLCASVPKKSTQDYLKNKQTKNIYMRRAENKTPVGGITEWYGLEGTSAGYLIQ